MANFEECGEPVAPCADGTCCPLPIVDGYGNRSDGESFLFEQWQWVDEMLLEPVGQVR